MAKTYITVRGITFEPARFVKCMIAFRKLERQGYKINKLQQDRNLIVGQIIKDQGGIEKLEKLINAKNKVESQ